MSGFNVTSLLKLMPFKANDNKNNAKKWLESDQRNLNDNEIINIVDGVSVNYLVINTNLCLG